jgi:DNA-binding NtrC family response regulator
MEQRPTILLVEDDASLREAMAGFLRIHGYEVQTAADGREAQQKIEPATDVVVADLVMPHIGGLELLRWVGKYHPGTGVILFTGHGTIPQAVEAIQAGAAAYVLKSGGEETARELLVYIQRELEKKESREELARLKGRLREGWHYAHIVGRSPGMQEVFALIDRAAPVKTTVLVIGESGTGKEMVARALHESGPRRGGPFLAINCGAIPENLIESTLFGHEKGAFTGADARSRGYFQAAHGGTLLLDEIGELPMGLQSKLLRVLEDGAVTPVGQTTPQKVDVRIVAATHRDLEAEAQAGRFRQDLFFRLNVIKIRLPPLRERPEDLPLLTRFFLDDICRQNNFEPREVEPALLEALQRYDWPGNVRELRNTLESLVILTGRKKLTVGDLPEKFFAGSAPDPGPEAERPGAAEAELNLSALSRQAIIKALEACRGNRTEAARQLGISRRTLHRRLNEFGLRE